MTSDTRYKRALQLGHSSALFSKSGLGRPRKERPHSFGLVGMFYTTVFMNQGIVTRNSSKESLDPAEKQFFSQGVWKDLSRKLVGINTLRDR